MTNLSTTAENILSTARKLVVAGGYNGFSYADIAREVGIRNASIHHHFPTKAGLVRALVADYRQQATRGLDDLVRQVPDPVEQIGVYVGYWRACIADASQPFCLCALLAGEIPVLPVEVAMEVKLHFQALAAWLASVFERGRTQGTMRLTGTPAEEAQMFMATVHGAMLSARAFGDPGLFALITSPLIDRIVCAH